MELPPLDCHAHVSPTVTDRQLAELGRSVVFAMTRDPAEAAQASRRRDSRLVWGCGAHPSVVARSGRFDIEAFEDRARDFAIVGEVGLDRRSGNLQHQMDVFSEILDRMRREPVILSVHSTGCAAQTFSLLKQVFRSGIIMHWFTGTRSQAEELLSLGCYFSINAAMQQELIEVMPIERILPETDYPSGRRRTGLRPGDTAKVEALLSRIHDVDPRDVRRRFYQNLRRLTVDTGAIDRMPSEVVDLLLTA